MVSPARPAPAWLNRIKQKLSPPNLLFYTSATGFYENFVVPYVFFAGLHNPGAKFEFIVTQRAPFIKKHAQALAWLAEEMGLDPVIRDKSVLREAPQLENSIRFVTQPKTRAKYVYIGDVDIMILEDVYAWHKPVFDAGLPYSNVIRKNSQQLTGLHFTSYAAMYPLGDIRALVATHHNDEALLYAMMQRKGILYENTRREVLLADRVIHDTGNVPFRPAHGIHMSLNRLPFSFGAERPGWGISLRYAQAMQAICASDPGMRFFEALPHGPREVVANLVYLADAVCAKGAAFLSTVS